MFSSPLIVFIVVCWPCPTLSKTEHCSLCSLRSAKQKGIVCSWAAGMLLPRVWLPFISAGRFCWLLGSLCSQGARLFSPESLLRQLIPSLLYELLLFYVQVCIGLHKAFSVHFLGLSKWEFVLKCQVENFGGLGVASHAAQLSQLSSSCLKGKGRVGGETQTPYSCRTLPVRLCLWLFL